MNKTQEILRIPLSGEIISAVEFVDQILTEAVRRKASDIHIEIYLSFARLRYRLDGILKRVRTNNFLFTEYSAVTTRIKVLAELDITRNRFPQDGRFSFSCEYGEADIRVSILPAVNGERIVLRIMECAGMGSDFSMLGMERTQIESVHRMLAASQGMVLVTGPTGSGKTTTLYTMLNILNSEKVNILTVENPVEKQVDGVGQVQIYAEGGFDFSHALRSFLRQDPEIIMIGEIRDFETADIAVKAALTGHLVLSTLHTNDAPTTITRLNSLGLPIPLLSDALNMIVSQRLTRLICPHCKVQDSVTREMVELLGFDGDVQLFCGRGCVECADTGYLGRRGVFEILEVNEEIRRLINDKSSLEKIARCAIKGETLTRAGQILLLDGHISLSEYQRVFWRPI